MAGGGLAGMRLFLRRRFDAGLPVFGMKGQHRPEVEDAFARLPLRHVGPEQTTSGCTICICPVGFLMPG